MIVVRAQGNRLAIFRHRKSAHVQKICYDRGEKQGLSGFSWRNPQTGVYPTARAHLTVISIAGGAS
jgi:hypothetical protein